LCRPGIERARYGRVHLFGHELGELLVLAPLGAGLYIPGAHPADTFHVGGDEDFELAGLSIDGAREPKSKRVREEQQSAGEESHESLRWPLTYRRWSRRSSGPC